MRAQISFLVLAILVLPAHAETDFASSMRLRGGVDTNPLLTAKSKGAAFVTLEGVLAAGRKIEGWTSGVTMEMSATKFSEQEFRAFQNHRFRLRLSNDNVDGLSFDGTTTLAASSTYDTRVAAAAQRIHLQYVEGPIRPFAEGDFRLVALNELNPLIGDFLPDPMRFMRGTITPGVAYVDGKKEAGISLTMGRTKYESDTDFFGFRRDHNRLEPKLYAKYEGDALNLRGSISYFRAFSEDELFSDVSHFLFDFGAGLNWPGWSANLSLAQTAEETTFPVSPMTVNRLLQARLTNSIDDNTTLAAFAKHLRREYWDTPLYSTVRVVGIEANYAVSPELSLAAELAYSRAQLLSGDEADGVVATVSLTRRFNAKDKGVKQKK